MCLWPSLAQYTTAVFPKEYPAGHARRMYDPGRVVHGRCYPLFAGFVHTGDVFALQRCALPRVRRLLRRYSEMFAQLTSIAPPVQQAVSHCVDGSVVGLYSLETCLLCLCEPGVPAGMAHKAAEALLKAVKKEKGRLIMTPPPNW